MLDRDLVAAALPDYELGDEIGRGAWGIVLSAQHRQLGRAVAVKQLPRAFGADAQVRARFLHEARLLASLDHPHIVPVYDFVERDGLCLLVMEKLPGGSIWRRFTSTGLSMPSACAAVLATCSALHHAHERGILHRDVKPENLLLSGGGTVKVSDFGIATVVGGSRTVATRAGEVLGTPAYMAPEQAQAKKLSPATDVYALAVVLYELLSGCLPYEDDGDPLAMLYQHVHGDPVPLSEIAPSVPAPVAAVTMRGMSRVPEDRCRSAEQYGIDLAQAAAEAWGPQWMTTSEFTLAAVGPILTAAHGGSTGVQQAPDVAPFGAPVPGPAAAAAAVPAPSALLTPSRPTVHKVHPGAVVADPGELMPANVAVDEHMADRGGPTDGAPPGPGDGQPRRRVPTRAWVAGAVAVAAIVAVVLMTGSLRSPDARSGAQPGAQSATSTPVRAAPPGAGAWRAVQELPSPRQQAAAAVADGTIWVVGGLEGDHSIARVEGYDPAIDTWKAGPDLPVPLHHAMAVTFRRELVVLGGWVPAGSNLTADVSARVFALRAGQWVELPSLNRPRAAGAAATVGDKIVVAGGQADGRLVAVSEIFDGTAWQDAPDMLTPRDHLAAASDGRYFYAVGGRSRSADRNVGAVERFDPATGEWDALPSLPTPRGGLGVAIVDGWLLAAGGENPTSVFDTVEAFDIQKGTWSTFEPLPTGRHGLTLVTVGSSVYAIGGSVRPTHAEASSVAEVLDLA